MRLSLAIAIFFIFLSSHIAIAGDEMIIVRSPGGHSAQDAINEALKKAADNPGSTVYLSSENGPFVVDGPSKIGSYTRLTGDSDAVIEVWEGSSQWYTGNIGIVMPIDGVILKKVLIEGFSIDGNCDKLPQWHANYGNGDHNAERLIFLRGYSNQKTGFMSDITIRNMRLYDAYCDGIHVSFAENVYCYDNVISNCQHEGIFFTCVVDAIVKGNKIAGIISDCFRTDNGVNNLITNNYFHSYTGDNNNGATKGRHQGVQVADKGYSHGGGVTAGHELPLKTTNIEICYNVFSGAKRMNFWIDSTGKGTKNVYVHHNTIIDGETLETKGTPVKINGENVIDHNFSDNISYINPPTLEESEGIFASIFDIMRKAATFTYPKVEADHKAYADVTYQANEIQPYSLVDVQGENIKLVKFEYNETITKHFIDYDIWTNTSHVGSSLYIPGHFKADDLKITVYSEAGYEVVEDIRVHETDLEASINPNLYIFLAVLGILLITVLRNLGRLS